MSCFVCGDKPVARFRDRWPLTEVTGLPVHKGCQRDLASAFDGWSRITGPDEPVIRWASNFNVPPRDLRELWVKLGYMTPEQAEASERVYRAELDAFLADYRANPPGRSAEELYEIRAAFGDESVVDVITGERIQ
jgi:hypothetical protein